MSLQATQPANTYFFSQLSGPLSTNNMKTILAQYTPSDPLLTYWYNLSIDTASDAELTAIGYLVGLPWPSAPDNTFLPNSFKTGAAASYPADGSINGLSGIGLFTGGYLSSAIPSPNNKIPISAYRLLLKAFAQAKWYGLTLQTIDSIVASFGSANYVYLHGFTLSAAAAYPQTDLLLGLSGVGLLTGGRLSSVTGGTYVASGTDITVAYITPVTTAELWVINNLFQTICTSPQVYVIQA